MDNRPKGREKHVTGPGKGVNRRGSGLGTGPVGRSDGYCGRGGASGGGNRSSGGRNPLSYLLILAVLLLGGGGVSFLGGGGEAAPAPQSSYHSAQSTQSSQVSGDFGGANLLSSLLGGPYSGGASVSTGWSEPSNTGKLDTSVASGAREKRTRIKGNGQDQVTLMVYLCGTDLESKNGMATSDLQEMASAKLGENVNLLVYTGGCKRWKNNIVSSSVNQVYKVEEGGVRCLVKDDGNDSLTKPATLTRFIKYCTKQYPANRYQLIFWDHGGGSISGYGYDEKHQSAGSMNLRGISDALAASKTSFDFIGFDACLMATLETGLMLEPYADYLIASEETEPGVGWYYTNWLTALSQDTSMPTVEIGKNIVDDYVSVCNQRCAGQKTTLSVVDLAELSATVPENLKRFSTATAQMVKSAYKSVSDARSKTREFAPSSRIDQVDLVHLAKNLGSEEGEKLAQALLGAVKYNKTSSSMTNAYGLSIYFPYQRKDKVDKAVADYSAIGMDNEYASCIKAFAAMGSGGQAISGGASDPYSALFGPSASAGSSGGAQMSYEEMMTLMSALLGGGSERTISAEEAVDYLSANQFDESALVWNTSADQAQMRLSEEQWSMVHDLQLNVFYDDGEGYVDLGLDNVYSFTEDGALSGQFDGTWLAIDEQPVAYYYVDSVFDGDAYTITGRVPVMLNGSRANLILVFDNDHPYGTIAGARMDYVDGETDTIAKGMTQLEEGDQIDFVCDFYGYDGSYQDSYLLGDTLTYTGSEEISNVYLNQEHPEKAIASYLFTDIYGQEHWTSPIP